MDTSDGADGDRTMLRRISHSDFASAFSIHSHLAP